MAPRTGARNVQMIAPGFGGKCRAAIGGDEGPERGSRPDESAALAIGLVVVSPFAVDQYAYAHDRHSSVCQPEGLHKGRKSEYCIKSLRRRSGYFPCWPIATNFSLGPDVSFWG